MTLLKPPSYTRRLPSQAVNPRSGPRCDILVVCPTSPDFSLSPERGVCLGAYVMGVYNGYRTFGTGLGLATDDTGYERTWADHRGLARIAQADEGRGFMA